MVAAIRPRHPCSRSMWRTKKSQIGVIKREIYPDCRAEHCATRIVPNVRGKGISVAPSMNGACYWNGVAVEERKSFFSLHKTTTGHICCHNLRQWHPSQFHGWLLDLIRSLQCFNLAGKSAWWQAGSFLGDQKSLTSYLQEKTVRRSSSRGKEMK